MVAMIDVIISERNKRRKNEVYLWCVDATDPRFEVIISSNPICVAGAHEGDRVRISNLIRKRSILSWVPVLLTTDKSELYEPQITWEKT